MHVLLVPLLFQASSGMNLIKQRGKYQRSAKWLHNLEIRARGYKTFFMLNSVEHEILNARKYKNI